MANDPFNSSPTRGYTLGSSIDAGLQAFMQSTYRSMILGLAVTGFTSYIIAATPALAAIVFTKGVMLVTMLAVVVLSFIAAPMRMQALYRSGTGASAGSIRTVFLINAVLFGILTSSLFAVYTGTSIARTFFITAAAFAGTSLYGYTTRRDLTSMMSFMVMGFWGIFIAMLVNLFLHSAMIYFVTSILGVVIFTGMTAWETQMIKGMYRPGNAEANARLSISAAFDLYMNFINIFMFLIRFTGDRR